jgi:very-short-patch-repair endonuclease
MEKEMKRQNLEERVRSLANDTLENWFQILWLHNAHDDGTPIEKLFRLALKIIEQTDFCITVDPPPDWFSTVTDPDMPYVITQAKIPGTKYVADFLFTSTAGKMRKLVVECDGHDFHERTKEQAEHDKKRDRKLTELGYTVLRFTGREIWRDPMACALQAIDIQYEIAPRVAA